MTTPPYGEHINVLRDFGAVGDGVTDDWAAIQAALDSQMLNAQRDEYAASAPVYIPPVDKFYRCSKTLVISRSMRVFGAGGRQTSGSRLKFDPGVTGIWVRRGTSKFSPADYPFGPGGHYATIEGLRIQGGGLGDGDPGARNGGGWAHGIFVNTTCRIIDNDVSGFSGDGFFFNAKGAGLKATPDDRDVFTGTSFGNCNACRVDDNRAFLNGGNGFRWLGADANACTVIGNDATRNGLCGFLDQSMLGNNLLSNHAAANTHKIESDGVIYACIVRHESSASNRPGTGENWRDYWQPVVSTIGDDAWQEGRVYYRSGSYHGVHASSTMTAIANYSEGGIQGKQVVNKNATVFAGAGTGGRETLKNTEATIVGGYANSWPIQVAGGPEGSGSSWQVKLGGFSAYQENPTYFSAGHSSDSSDLSVIQMVWSGTRKAYEWIRKGVMRPILSITGENWSTIGYEGPGHLVAPRGIIVQGASEHSARISAVWSMNHIAGEVVKGEIWILTGAGAAGPHFAKCTKSGVVGADAEIVTF